MKRMNLWRNGGVCGAVVLAGAAANWHTVLLMAMEASRSPADTGIVDAREIIDVQIDR